MIRIILTSICCLLTLASSLSAVNTMVQTDLHVALVGNSNVKQLPEVYYKQGRVYKELPVSAATLSLTTGKGYSGKSNLELFLGKDKQSLGQVELYKNKNNIICVHGLYDAFGKLTDGKTIKLWSVPAANNDFVPGGVVLVNLSSYKLKCHFGKEPYSKSATDNVEFIIESQQSQTIPPFNPEAKHNEGYAAFIKYEYVSRWRGHAETKWFHNFDVKKIIVFSDKGKLGLKVATIVVDVPSEKVK